MSQPRYTADSITDDALDALYANASKGWRRGDIWKAKAVEIEADRDQLLAELGGRDEEARERWLQKQEEQLGIKWADFRAGRWEMDLAAGREFAAAYVAAARALLGDAPNYSQTKLEFDVKIAESPEIYTLVVQRHAPGALTPHEARQQAEAARDDVLRIVSGWCIESNNHGGIDAGDLAWRLEQAGHHLPEEDA